MKRKFLATAARSGLSTHIDACKPALRSFARTNGDCARYASAVPRRFPAISILVLSMTTHDEPFIVDQGISLDARSCLR